MRPFECAKICHALHAEQNITNGVSRTMLKKKASNIAKKQRRHLALMSSRGGGKQSAEHCETKCHDENWMDPACNGSLESRRRQAEGLQNPRRQNAWHG
jgi:hypothetical protein